MSSPYDPHKHNRRSIRLKGYDYRDCGTYFITVCAQRGQCLFGEVVDDEMHLNGLGQIVRECWEELAAHYAGVELDAFVVMPNHVHGMLWVVPVDAESAKARRADLKSAPTVDIETSAPGGSERADGTSPAPGKHDVPEIIPVRHGLPEIVRGFKALSSRRINASRGTPGGRIWQRNYYEHIVRTEEALNDIRQYIRNNPLKWASDEENPNRSTGGP